MKSFLTFRKMISPWLIQLAFWIAVVFFISTAIVDITRGSGFLFGLEILILGPIAARIVCEVLIIFFRMNDNLTEMRNQLTKKNI